MTTAMLLFSAALAATPSQTSALGPNVHVFSPDDDMKKVAETVETVFKRQRHRQFGPERQAFLFLPGDYTKAGTLNVGYYTQVLGLGRCIAQSDMRKEFKFVRYCKRLDGALQEE